MMRSVLMAVVAAAVLLGSAKPAAPPDYPVSFIKVEELKALLDRGTKADIIDVRTWAAYEEMHIKGARSMPVRVVEPRANEISKTDLVVLY